MKCWEVCEGMKSRGLQFAETDKEAIRFTRMELLAAGHEVVDDGWHAHEYMPWIDRFGREIL